MESRTEWGTEWGTEWNTIVHKMEDKIDNTKKHKNYNEAANFARQLKALKLPAYRGQSQRPERGNVGGQGHAWGQGLIRPLAYGI